MRFLIDECTGPAVAEWLRNQRYEVFSVFDEKQGNDRWSHHPESISGKLDNHNK